MILLINPPNPPNAVSNKDMMGGFGQLYGANSLIKVPPIDLAYIAALLKREKINFNVFECLGLGWDISKLLKQLGEIKTTKQDRTTKPWLIGIRTSTPTFKWDLKVADLIKSKLKKLNLDLNSKIVFFGPHVAVYSNETITYSSIDAIIFGEPEFAFLSIAKKGFENTEGIWFKKDGQIIKNKPREFIENLNELPFPAWDLLPYTKYYFGEYLRYLQPAVTVLTSRGCPYNCDYCPYPLAQGKKWRARTALNIVNELQYIENKFGVKAVLFRDPEFSLDKKRTIDICKAIINKRLKIKWRCETRIDTLDEEIIDLFAKAGCIGINVGIESVNAKVLKRTNRKVFSLKKAIKIINVCKKNKIEAFVFFILGLPGETVQSTLTSVKYAKKLNPQFVQFTVVTPYKGTKLYDWAEKKGYIGKGFNLEKVTGFEVVMGNENISKEKLQELVKFAYDYFNA